MKLSIGLTSSQNTLHAEPAEQPLLVNLEGLITNRPSAEPGQPPQRTLVVERFVGVHPGQGCPQPNPSANTSPARTAATG